MTNVSKAGIAVLSLVALAAVLSFGAFIVSAHADDSYDLGSYGGGYDLGSYDGGYDSGSYDTGSYDLGSYDSGCSYGCGGTDLGSYGTTDLGSYDSNCGCYGNSSSYDLGSYDQNCGCYDNSSTYDLGSYDSNCGCYSNSSAYDLGAYDTGSAYDLGAYDQNCGCYATNDTYSQDCGCYTTNDTTYENGVGYSEQSYPIQPSYTPSAPISFSAPPSYYPPSFPSYPTPIYPQQPPVYPRPTPTPIPQPIIPPANVTNNTCTNGSCNYSQTISNSGNTIVSNSGNTVTTVIPVQQAPIQYPAQYTFPQPTYQPPYCTITLNNSGGAGYGQYGNQLATLTWSSSYGSQATISQIGAVPPSGSRTVYPTPGQVFTMIVSGPNGSANCQTQSYYAPVPPPQAPSVSLSQIPYTGFDFGPIGNAIYWFAMLSFAAALAYLAVYYRGGYGILATALAKTTASKVNNAVHAPVKMVESVIAPVAKKIDMVIAPANARGTTDSMKVMSGRDGGAPRIVISRS